MIKIEGLADFRKRYENAVVSIQVLDPWVARRVIKVKEEGEKRKKEKEKKLLKFSRSLTTEL
jgi:hypothetical protein